MYVNAVLPQDSAGTALQTLSVCNTLAANTYLIISHTVRALQHVLCPAQHVRGLIRISVF